MKSKLIGWQYMILPPIILSCDNMSEHFFRNVQPFAKNSLPNGMQMLIDVEAFDYAVSSTGSEGLILSILHQLDIPIMKNIGINVQPGTWYTSKQFWQPKLQSNEAKIHFETQKCTLIKQKYTVFHHFGQAKFACGRSILSLTNFCHCPSYQKNEPRFKWSKLNRKQSSCYLDLNPWNSLHYFVIKQLKNIFTDPNVFRKWRHTFHIFIETFLQVKMFKLPSLPL